MIRSEAEASLAWQLTHGLPMRSWSVYEQEHRFAAPRRWRFDFAWPDRRLAVEVEGGSYVNGRHTRGAGFEADCEKYAEAAIRGWRVIRVTPRMIEDGRAINFIIRGLTT